MNAIQRPKFDPKKFYEAFRARLQAAREATGLYRPLTYGEKILLAHLHNPSTQEWESGKATLALVPDHAAMQDATAQMTLLQVYLMRKHGILQKALLSASVHCDHLITAEKGVDVDFPAALAENAEVYTFLRHACAVFGIEFNGPDRGIIHQVVLEDYAYPGMLLIGTDSHTPNAGGIGAFPVGVGGVNAALALAGQPWKVRHPKKIGVRLTGEFTGFAAAKDVITNLCVILGKGGGKDQVIEYFGPGVSIISATGRATICNMGAELGATTSIFPVDAQTIAYLRATGRQELADAVEENLDLFQADPDVLVTPSSYFDRVIEINLSELEPYVVGPGSPNLGRNMSKLGEEATAKGWPTELKDVYIGSCTNSSIEDIASIAHIAAQAQKMGLRLKARVHLSPGSDRTMQTARRLGYIDTLESAGVVFLAQACGPCIGNLRRPSTGPNSVVTSFNRNFRGRLDGNPETQVFITSADMAMVYGYYGSLVVPASMEIETPMGMMTFTPPPPFFFPTDGFEPAVVSTVEDVDDILIDPKSERLAFLELFDRPDITVPLTVTVLGKVRGNKEGEAVTTDAISPAGEWLEKRGHLPLISDNMLLMACDAFDVSRLGRVRNLVDPEEGGAYITPAALAKKLKARGVPWAIVSDKNHGDGSSREHAAMSPRYLGCRVVIARSIERIHEENLEFQGIIPLTFADPADYDRVRDGDVIKLPPIQDFVPGQAVMAVFSHEDGTSEEILLNQRLTPEKLEYIKAGSVINWLIANQAKSAA